jgi:NADP-dependent aldehyde dehydrogenase
MTITGENIIGLRFAAGSDAPFQAIDPSTGQFLDPPRASAGPAEADQACALAASAFDAFRALPLTRRAEFLEAIATEIEALGDELIVRAMAESGLPRGRLEGERGRTTGQLRLFAQVVRQGDFLGVRVDPALPDRKPAPRPDLRQRMIPLGPVAVFGASNFPLAFSVAGGDTAAALAAGCPVVVKGHPSHPGAGELVGRAIRAAAEKLDLPEGVFSLLTGPSNALGQAIVANPRIKAVGFTGSRAGGLALAKIAAERAEPIPVYAEMSSINPVILAPAALAARGEALAKGFIGSLTLGAGQFCTNPGVILAIDGPDLDAFLEVAAAELAAAPAAVMLSPGIHKAYESGVAALAGHEAVTERARSQPGEGVNRCAGALFETTSEAFLADPALSHEVFGAASVVVRCPDAEAIAAVLEALEGQLTATLQIDDADLGLAQRLLPVLERKVGRILVNGWPTGVEVSHAMVHGGPFPATSDSRSTSVGTLAIARFLRPVCYQAFPDALLPSALQEGNPDGLARRIDGVMAPAH